MSERTKCPVCGTEFEKTRDWHVFCSEACRIKNWRDRWILKRPRRPSEVNRG